jgi:Tol biopolymer transport system component
MKRLMQSLVTVSLVAVLLASGVLAQSGEITPGDNLVVEGVTPIPAALADEVGRYTEFRSASLSSWHPTRREMLISTRFGDTNQVHVVKMPGGARTQLTFFRERAGGASYQPKTGASFVFNRDVGGNEFFQFYRYDLGDGTVTLLTDGKSRNTDWNWSHAGDRAVYSSTRRNGTDTDLYIINPSQPKSDRMLLQLEGGGWDVSDWSADDQKLLLMEYISVNEGHVWLVDVAKGEKTLVTKNENVAYGRAQFSKDGRGIYVTTDKDSEFARLAYVDLASKRHTFLTDHIKWDVDSFDLSPDGKTIALITNEEGLSRLRFIDTKSGKEKPAPTLPVGIIGGVRWHENGQDLGFNMVSARSPSDIYSLNVRTGKLERWTQSETGGSLSMVARLAAFFTCRRQSLPARVRL